MRYTGKWVFHSIGMVNDSDELVYLSAEEYLKAPMPYVDESDEEAVADEMRERRQIIGGQFAVCEDGKLYMLMSITVGASNEEIDQAVSEGIIQLYDGMLTEAPKAWKEQDCSLWMEVGEEICEGGLGKALRCDGYLTFSTARYVKAE